MKEQKENSAFLASDKPQKDPENDLFGYTPFAERLAESIQKMTPPEGLVMAIYGPWGSGKSTLLEFVAHYLEESDDEQVIIIRFNPWWFSGHKDLTLYFFAHLQATLFSKFTSLTNDAKKRIADFGKLVSKVPFSGAELVGAVFESFGNNEDIATQKEKVEELLREQKKKILVIIDDIDRLAADEIKDIFRLVKSIADFPYVSYLLAFDKTVVANSLHDLQGVSGQDYLEKIVQVPFELPQTSPDVLFHILLQELNKLLGVIPRELDQIGWFDFAPREGYLSIIKNFIRTPRDVVRFINTLSVTFPIVKDEVSVADFVAVEAIRVFYPEVYNEIRRHRDVFCGYQASDNHREVANSILEIYSYDISLKSLLDKLFPKLQNNLDASHEKIWRKNLRICSPDLFDIYFSLNIPDTSFSQLELKRIRASIDDVEAFKQELVMLAEQDSFLQVNRAGIFLGVFRDYVDDIPAEHIGNIIEAFFAVGHKLIKADAIEVPGQEDVEWKMGYITIRSLEQLDAAQRFDLLSKAIAAGNSIRLMVSLLIHLGREHGKFDSDKKSANPLITLDELGELEKILLTKVRLYAGKNDLLNDRRSFRNVVYFWRIVDREGVREWSNSVAFMNIQNLLKFLRYFIRYDPDGDFVILEELSNYLNLSLVWEMIFNLPDVEALPENDKDLIQLFTRSYQERQNKDP